ncbi:MAG: YfiR family protein [Flavobacterium sp.]|nr:YfiR family protein [Flavobacterium sp.]
MSILNRLQLRLSFPVPSFSKYMLLIWFTFTGFAQTPTAEYKVKAAFVYNLTHFVTWPETEFASPDAPLVIGIYGENPFGYFLEQMIKDEFVQGHELKLQHITDIDKAKDCHLLYINVDESKDLQSIITKLKNKRTLTVSDAPTFVKIGGMVRLFTVNDKINIEINLEEVRCEQLQISAKLLKLAQISD